MQRPALLLLAALAGCAVGPNFTPPAPPSAHAYTEGETVQPVALGKAISGQWWDLFRSAPLDGVVRAALADSRTLVQARATLAAARENMLAARGGYWPQADVSASAAHRKRSGLAVGAAPGLAGFVPQNAANVYSLGPTVSYAPDVFGATGRLVEEQQALAERQRYELAAAWLTLTGDAVTQAITIASLRAQIRATEAVLADDERNVSLVRLKYQAGKAARLDLLTAQTQLDSDRAPLPPLRQQLAAARHALSVLAGRAPAQGSPPAFDLDSFTLPGELPVSLPSALVHQRPDILAAEAQLHADSAAIGVAAAKLYPTITLSASFTQQALDTASLFDSANSFWSLAGNLAAPLFHGGTLRAQRRAAVDTYRASLAAYEQTVLQAFQQVADSLTALGHDAELVDAERRLLDSASAALALQQESYRAGKSDVLQLISAERAYAQARLGSAKAEAQRLQDAAQLLLAVGGGWWNAKG